MSQAFRFLIVDGYPRPSRDEFNRTGMKLAGELYADLLLQHLPDAVYDLSYSSDPGVELPDKEELKAYNGLIWPGCNLTVYKTEDERVKKMLDLCINAYEAGIPQFGSCWGIQIAVFVAGGEVKPNPKGREMGIARKIRLTDTGRQHPMFKGKTPVFSHFVSHDDEVTRLPDNAELLAGNDFSRVQAVAVKFKKGIFWGVQYHPEYNLYEMARLIAAREEKLTSMSFFKNHDDMTQYVEKLEELYREPRRKDLRWQLGIDDDLLSDSIRQCEFINWINENIVSTNLSSH